MTAHFQDDDENGSQQENKQPVGILSTRFGFGHRSNVIHTDILTREANTPFWHIPKPQNKHPKCEIYTIAA